MSCQKLGTRLDTVDDQPAEPGRERANHECQRQEHLHANRESAGSRGEQARHDESYEQNQPDRTERDEQQPRHVPLSSSDSELSEIR